MKYRNFSEKVINIIPVFFISFLLTTPVSALAGGNVPGQLANPIGYQTAQEFILAVLAGLIKIGTPVIAIAVIYCGFLFVAARGNSEKITKAKEAFFYTLIGAAILLGSLALATLVKDTVLSLN